MTGVCAKNTGLLNASGAGPQAFNSETDGFHLPLGVVATPAILYTGTKIVIGLTHSGIEAVPTPAIGSAAIA